MINAETLRKYLPCHATYGDFDLCIECPYNPNHGKIWQYGCAHGQDKMIEDTIALLKEQEAKLLQREAELDILRNIYKQENPYKQAVKWDDK